MDCRYCGDPGPVAPSQLCDRCRQIPSRLGSLPFEVLQKMVSEECGFRIEKRVVRPFSDAIIAYVERSECECEEGEQCARCLLPEEGGV